MTFTDGTTTDIAGAMCGGGGGDAQTSNGSTILGIYVLAANTLQLGDGGGNEVLGTVSPGTRSSSVDSSVYTEQ